MKPLAELFPANKTYSDYIPGEVMELVFVKGMTITRAWREYLGLLQSDVAEKLGLTQGAYSKLEAKKKHKQATRAKLAQVFGIFEDQLDIE